MGLFLMETKTRMPKPGLGVWTVTLDVFCSNSIILSLFIKCLSHLQNRKQQTNDLTFKVEMLWWLVPCLCALLRWLILVSADCKHFKILLGKNPFYVCYCKKSWAKQPSPRTNSGKQKVTCQFCVHRVKNIAVEIPPCWSRYRMKVLNLDF